MSDGRVFALYLTGALLALLFLVWYNRKSLAAGDWGSEGEIALAVVFGTIAWPIAVALSAVIGFFWFIAHGAELTARGMLYVEQRSDRKRMRRALAEKAQREIFADIDALLRDGRDAEIRDFMSKLKAVA